MLEEFIEYAKIKAPLGSSRFTVERLNGDEVETTLQGSLRNKSKNNRIEKGDWVRIENLGMSVSGSSYKIVERIGNDKDKSVKDLRKNGFLNTKKEVVKESTILDSSNFEDEVKSDEESEDDFIDDL